MTEYPDYIGTAKKPLEQQAEINRLKEEIKQLRAERDKLVELLKPFAQDVRPLGIAPYRAAREALAKLNR